LPLAHRGLHGDGAPENSLSAFAAARDAGYGVELDVHLTRDGVPVVVHDGALDRVTGAALKVGSATLTEVQRNPLLGGDEPVPTLADTLRVLGPTPTMVEVKSLRVGAGRVERVVADLLDGHDGPWCIAGFNPASVRWFRRNRPEVPRVLTSGPPGAFVPLPRPVRRRLAALTDLATVAPVAVSYDLAGLPTDVTDAWRDGGGLLVTWTVKDEDDLRRARDLADNIIFENVRP
jgi:glycerophosphoryl diester phosphodiesterase